MRVICAPDSFKGTISAVEVAKAMARGVRAAKPDCVVDLCPIGDGGEGTLEAILLAAGGLERELAVTGPLGGLVTAHWGRLTDGRTAVIEMAQAAGLGMLSTKQRDPSRTTTFGVGELLLEAVNAGCREIILFIGGSATVDGGTGLAQALGVRFFDSNDEPIVKRMCGALLKSIVRIGCGDSARERFAGVHLRVACDVTNPLSGPNGAAAVYGPQKGATPTQVKELDTGLKHLAETVGVAMHTSASSPMADPSFHQGGGDMDPDSPGMGASGGLGFGAMAFGRLCGMHATIERGIDLVLEIARFRERCSDADLVLTGEGRFDSQSTQGKAVMGVAQAAKECGVNTFAVVGDMTSPIEGREVPVPLRGIYSLTERFGFDRATCDAAECIAEIAADVVTVESC